ncbi:MAG: mandelate racemase/muconate lactonizing enzyme family protein [Candidatus Bathyarchaeia archaeon]
MKITRVESFHIDIPWREPLREYMDWAGQPHRSWLYRLHTDDGLVGLCESFEDARVLGKDLVGKNPFEYVLNDSVWPLQEALYDLMAQALGLPLYRLLGRKQREKVPVCYWSHHFPPELLAEEAAAAAEEGFTFHKFKARPRFDPVEQAKSIADATPENAIIPDANGSFWLPSKAVAFARGVEDLNILCLESPIPQSDVQGYLAIKSRVDTPLAIHMGEPNPIVALAAGMADYYVLEVPGVAATLGYAAIAENAAGRMSASGNEGKGYTFGGRPVWLEGFGRTGVSEAFQVHLAAVVKTATLPSPLFLHRLREHPLIEEPLPVKDGHVAVQEKPGLGVTLDERALKKYAAD